MFPACTVNQAEKALAMALGNLEEAVQLIVEEKVEIGPAGAGVKVLYSELGGSGPRSRAELRARRVSQLSAASRSFDRRNLPCNEPGGSPRTTPPLPPSALSTGHAHSRASTPAELWLAPPFPQGLKCTSSRAYRASGGHLYTPHVVPLTRLPCLLPGTRTATQSTQPRGTKTGYPTEVSTQQQRTPYSAPSKGDGGSLGKVRMIMWSIKNLGWRTLRKEAAKLIRV